MTRKLIYNAHTREAVDLMIERCVGDGDDFKGITNIAQLREYIRDELEWSMGDYEDKCIADMEDVNWDKVFRTLLHYRGKLRCHGCEEIMDSNKIILHERLYPRDNVVLCDDCTNETTHDKCMTCDAGIVYPSICGRCGENNEKTWELKNGLCGECDIDVL